MTANDPLTATGARVVVRPVQREDLQRYRRAVQLSRERLSRWNPVDPDDLLRHLSAQSDLHRTFLVLAVQRGDGADDHGIVGKINVTNVVRGRFQSAALGYDAYDPYVGRGLFREGLGLVVGLALTGVDKGGMGLHRVEASVQPGNVTSAGVLRSLGFRHEGSTPRMLWLRGPDGREDWCDHERFAVTAQEWPAEPYRRHDRRRVVVLVNGLPGSGAAMLAAELAHELGLPLLSRGTIVQAVADQRPAQVLDEVEDGGSWLGAGTASVWGLLAACPLGAVVEGGLAPEHRSLVDAGLRRAGLDPACSVEVWCDVPPGAARQRFERTHDRHAVPGGAGDASPAGAPEPATGRPLGLGTVLRVDASLPLSRGAVVRVALAARAAAR